MYLLLAINNVNMIAECFQTDCNILGDKSKMYCLPKSPHSAALCIILRSSLPLSGVKQMLQPVRLPSHPSDITLGFTQQYRHYTQQKGAN